MSGRYVGKVKNVLWNKKVADLKTDDERRIVDLRVRSSVSSGLIDTSKTTKECVNN